MSYWKIRKGGVRMNLKRFIGENPKILSALRSEVYMRKKHGKNWFKKYEEELET